MNVIPTSIDGVIIVSPQVFKDNRGYFLETYQKKRYAAVQIHSTFVQDNLSFSKKNTLRGLHYQIQHPQAKLVQVISGEIFDVAVDLRPGSKTYGKWTGHYLSDVNNHQLFVPEGFAHGFCVISETAYFSYKCSDFYYPNDEGGIHWSDPAIGIQWPLENAVISDKDNRLPFLSDLSSYQLPCSR